MNELTTPSTLGRLRALAPRRDRVSFDDALRVAELQATRLQELLGADVGVHESGLAALPRIAIKYEDIAVSGMSHWNGQEWVIVLHRGDGWARQRFTLLHEFKHIVDHGHSANLYSGDRKLTSDQQSERAADFFAGCALVPRRQLKAAWGHGIQRLAELAIHFGVSEDAMTVRLSQTGLSTAVDNDPVPRCARPIATPARTHPQRVQPSRTARHT